MSLTCVQKILVGLGVVDMCHLLLSFFWLLGAPSYTGLSFSHGKFQAKLNIFQFSFVPLLSFRACTKFYKIFTESAFRNHFYPLWNNWAMPLRQRILEISINDVVWLNKVFPNLLHIVEIAVFMMSYG